MKDMFLKFILSVDETTNLLVLIISIVSGIISIVSEIRKNKEKKQNVWITKCIMIVSVLVFICTIVRSNLTQVPNVVGKTYQDACHILSDMGLNYNLVQDDWVYIMEQNPVAGTVVKKGYQVELITEPIGNNPELKKEWEIGLGVDFGNIAIKFKDIQIVLEDEGKTKECFGPILTDYVVKEAYLLEENVGVEYHDYVIENGTMIFRNIPQGIPFQLIVLLEGYEEAKTEVVASCQNMVDGTYTFTWGITSSSMERLLPTYFYVADASKSTLENVEYLSDVKLWVQWPNDFAWRGDYFTNANGRFPYSIEINEEHKIKVNIINPFGNGVDYECEVTLYNPVIGEAFPEDIVFLKPDGSCNVINTAEYFAW